MKENKKGFNLTLEELEEFYLSILTNAERSTYREYQRNEKANLFLNDTPRREKLLRERIRAKMANEDKIISFVRE